MVVKVPVGRGLTVGKGVLRVWVLDRRMIGNEVHQDEHSAHVRCFYQRPEILFGAVICSYVKIIGDLVAEVTGNGARDR